MYYISCGLADLYTDLRGCTYGLAGLSMTTELEYSFSGFVWLYIYGLSGLKFKKTIHMK